MMQSQENTKKPHFEPDLDPLRPNPVRQTFLFQKSGFVSH